MVTDPDKSHEAAAPYDTLDDVAAFHQTLCTRLQRNITGKPSALVHVRAPGGTTAEKLAEHLRKALPPILTDPPVKWRIEPVPNSGDIVSVNITRFEARNYGRNP